MSELMESLRTQVFASAAGGISPSMPFCASRTRSPRSASSPETGDSSPSPNTLSNRAVAVQAMPFFGGTFSQNLTAEKATRLFSARRPSFFPSFAPWK